MLRTRESQSLPAPATLLREQNAFLARVMLETEASPKVQKELTPGILQYDGFVATKNYVALQELLQTIQRMSQQVSHEWKIVEPDWKSRLGAQIAALLERPPQNPGQLIESLDNLNTRMIRREVRPVDMSPRVEQGRTGFVSLQPSHEQLIADLHTVPEEIREDLTLVIFDQHLDIEGELLPHSIAKTNFINTILHFNLAKNVVVVGISPTFTELHEQYGGTVAFTGDESAQSIYQKSGRLHTEATNFGKIDWKKILKTRHIHINVDIDAADIADSCEYSPAGFFLRLGQLKDLSDRFKQLQSQIQTPPLQTHAALEEWYGTLMHVCEQIFYALIDVFSCYPPDQRPQAKTVIQAVKELQRHCDTAGITRKIKLAGPESDPEQTLIGSIAEYIPELDGTGVAGNFVEELQSAFDYEPTLQRKTSKTKKKKKKR